ncbi:MAG: PEP-CTERM sorting domain-containing protein, partial [Microcystis sp.]
ISSGKVICPVSVTVVLSLVKLIESVPEPDSTLGILALGVLAAGSCFNRKLSQAKESKQDN